MTFVGVDIGTSVIKAAAFDQAGRQLALEAAPSGVASGRIIATQIIPSSFMRINEQVMHATTTAP